MQEVADSTHPSTVYTQDAVVPFLVNDANVRGRAARLQKSVNTILSRHNYPAVVKNALGELLVIASMLASNLKADGIFTIQVSGNGPVPMFVVDAVYGGALRGCAEVKGDVQEGATLSALTGEGYIAITLDQEGERYQGVVELKGESFSDMIQHYFVHSQQIDTFIRARVAQELDTESGEQQWVAGGLLIERMPEGEGGALLSPDDARDRWENALALSHTVKDAELLDVSLGLSDLLYRLYHEDGVWVYDAHTVSDGSAGSREKIERALATMAKDEVLELMEEGEISVHCHFSNEDHIFTEAQLNALFD